MYYRIHRKPMDIKPNYDLPYKEWKKDLVNKIENYNDKNKIALSASHNPILNIQFDYTKNYYNIFNHVKLNTKTYINNFRSHYLTYIDSKIDNNFKEAEKLWESGFIMLYQTYEPWSDRDRQYKLITRDGLVDE